MQEVLLHSDKCKHCAIIIDKIKASGKLDQYRLVNVSSAEGQLLVNKLDIKGVPECVIVDDKANKARLCTEEEWDALLNG